MIHLFAWVLGGVAILFFSVELVPVFRILSEASGSEERALLVLRDLREKLESGWLPSEDEWKLLGSLEEPWGPLAKECISDLRENGIPIVPTIRRLEVAIGAQKKAMQEARSRSAQAWGQALLCGAIVPGVALALYFLVPGLSAVGFKWWVCSLFAFFLDGVALLWMIRLADSARWAGLEENRREWWPAVFCFGERLLGALRGGIPADLAWSAALPQVYRQAPNLIPFWGADLWSESRAPGAGLERAAVSVLDFGTVLRKAIQTSIYEGRGCTERIEAALEALRIELSCEVERQIQLLSTRALQPLFLCVAPSVLLLLIFAFWLSFESWGIL